MFFNKSTSLKKNKLAFLFVAVFTHILLLELNNFYNRNKPMIGRRQELLWINNIKLLQPIKSKVDSKEAEIVHKIHYTPGNNKFEFNNSYLKEIISNNYSKPVINKKTEPLNFIAYNYWPKKNFCKIKIIHASQKLHHHDFKIQFIFSNYNWNCKGVALVKNANISPKQIDKKLFLEGVLFEYLDSIRKQVDKHKVYPRLARENGLEGTALVDLLLKNNGQLKKLRLVNSSNYKILDSATIKAINSASPFFPFPEHLKKNELWIRLTMSFSLY